MPVPRFLAAALCGALVAPAALGQITDLTTWEFYYDNDPGPGALRDATTGSSTANLAQLNFLEGEPVPAGYDIGYSSINANTVGGASAGHYFSAANDFAVSLDFSITLTNPNGLVALGLGIGEDRAGVNSAGIGFGLPTLFGLTGAEFQGAATNNDVAVFRDLGTPVNPFIIGSTYTGSLSADYDAATGDITVSATGANGTSGTTFTKASDLADWAGDDLLVSFFLRSDTASLPPFTVGPWAGDAAEADFVNFTVTQGSATPVPEPTSLALFGLGMLGLTRRRRRD